MKINQMSGRELDYAVAIALKYTRYPQDSAEQGSTWHTDPTRTPFGPTIWVESFVPSIKGWYLIEQFNISVVWDAEEQKWGATMDSRNISPGYLVWGGNCLEAAMRALAMHFLGTKLVIPQDISALKPYGYREHNDEIPF